MAWYLPDVPFDFDIDKIVIRNETIDGFDVHKVSFDDSFWHLVSVYGETDDSFEDLVEAANQLVESIAGPINNDSNRTAWTNYIVYNDSDTDEQNALRIDALYLKYM